MTHPRCFNHARMNADNPIFWAKTVAGPRGEAIPGISVRDHCVNVGCVAEALVAGLPAAVRDRLPKGAATLAALHDVGKITIGFQVKCPTWLATAKPPPCPPGDLALSVSDHAFVSQAFLQKLPTPQAGRLWAVAVGAHHGRPKGRAVRAGDGRHREALTDWAEAHRRHLLAELQSIFGPLPVTPPDPRLAPDHSGLWLLAGLITVADWIGSNECWFSPPAGLPLAKPSPVPFPSAATASNSLLPNTSSLSARFACAVAVGNATTSPSPRMATPTQSE